MSNEAINNEEEIIIPYEEVVVNLSELLTNSVNMVDKFYAIFFDPTPQKVELEMYNKQGELIKVSIPNRAMDRSVALFGEGSPEDKVEAFLGALYIDNYNSQLYIKQTQEGKMGWQNITPQSIKSYYDEFTIVSSTNKVILSRMIDDNNPPAVYVNGALIYPDKYEISYDKRTVNFTSTLATGSKVLVKYMLGTYGLKGETAITCKVGETETLAPFTPAYVKNVGTDKDLILNFGLPVGPLKWGNIAGTLSDQTDLKESLDGIQTTLDTKQHVLTAGNNIKIKNNVISVTGDLGTQVTMKIWD